MAAPRLPGTVSIAGQHDERVSDVGATPGLVDDHRVEVELAEPPVEAGSDPGDPRHDRAQGSHVGRRRAPPAHETGRTSEAENEIAGFAYRDRRRRDDGVGIELGCGPAPSNEDEQ